MADIVDRQTRSRMMAGIKGKNTKPELALRKALHTRGYRYRLHSKTVLGRPDLVLPKHYAVVFVHGCFWHRHAGCRYSTTPSTRAKFWQAKLEANIHRDQSVRTELLTAGWRVATIWECALRSGKRVDLATHLLVTCLQGEALEIDIGENDVIFGGEREALPNASKEQ